MHGSKLGKELITNQVDFLFVPADVFADAQYFGTEVKDGRLVVNGHEMNVLIVPECEFMPAAAAEFIAAHPELEVVYANSTPCGIAGPAQDADALLSAATQGRACVALDELADYLRAHGCTDELASGSTDGNLRQYHYRKGGRDFWLLMNSAASETVEMTFDVPDGRVYGFYDAMAEKTTRIDARNGSVSVVLRPYQSAIICSDPEHAAEPAPEYVLKDAIKLDDFDLTLHAIGSDTPEPIGTCKLGPISNTYRDFSGVIVYDTSFDLDAVPEKAVFAAQHVYECITVEANRVKAASTFTPPYELDITAALKAGRNDLRVSVATTALRDANTKPGMFGKERTVIEPTGMFGDVRVELYEKR